MHQQTGSAEPAPTRQLCRLAPAQTGPSPTAGRSGPPRPNAGCRPGAPRAEAAAPTLGMPGARGAVGSRRAQSPGAQGGGGGTAAAEGRGQDAPSLGMPGTHWAVGNRLAPSHRSNHGRGRRDVESRAKPRRHWAYPGRTGPLGSRVGDEWSHPGPRQRATSGNAVWEMHSVHRATARAVRRLEMPRLPWPFT